MGGFGARVPGIPVPRLAEVLEHSVGNDLAGFRATPTNLEAVVKACLGPGFPGRMNPLWGRSARGLWAESARWPRFFCLSQGGSNDEP